MSKNLILPNYTTQCPIQKSLMEAKTALIMHGVTDLIESYDGAGNCTGLKFAVNISGLGKVGFDMPVNAQGVFQLVQNYREQGLLRNISKKDATDINVARRSAWRNLADWIIAQTVLIDSGQVKIQQVFLPYIYDPKSDCTLFEMIEQTGYPLLEAGE